MKKPRIYFLLPILLCFLFVNTASSQRIHDTLRFKRPFQKNIVLTDSALNVIGIDSLLNKLEETHFAVNRINTIASMGFDTRDIEQDFPGVDSSIDIISGNLSLYTKLLDVKNLQLFDVLLTDLQKDLNEWRASLSKYNKRIAEMRGELSAIRHDTVLRSLMVDSAFSSLYGNEITAMRGRMRQAYVAIMKGSNKITHLQTELSNEYFEALELQTQVRDLLRKGGIKSMSKEYPYLWELSKASAVTSLANDSLVHQSYIGQRRILRYYFQRNWIDQLWMLIVGALFIFWVHRNYKKINKHPSEEPKFEPHYISAIPILATLVVLLNLAPFFNFHPPTAYVSIMQFLLIVVLTLLFRKHWSKTLFRYWLFIGALYLVFSFAGIVLTPGLFFRILLLSANVVSILFGLFWIRNFRKYNLNFSEMIRFVSVLYIILNAGAVICNLLGRLSLAKIFSITAIFSLTQVIGLSVFIETILEACELQTRVNRLRGGLTAHLGFDRIQQPLRKLFNLLAIGIWAIIFTNSLNIYDLVIEKLTIILTKPHKIGSTSFELGNLILFIIILYVSQQLQKGIGSLYGKTTQSWDTGVRKNASRLAIMRLALIVIGFLIAVAASGLPLDKITIVLGALGVGIGLGLQAIVNNFVSGIILIFEQPFRIGDYIELGDKKGRVIDIGIRSSKLMMEEGAEVIMPNADLLSGRVINWTIHNDNVRIDIPLVVETTLSFDDVVKAIKEILNNNEDVLKNQDINVLLTSINEKTMNINVLAWVTNVNRVQFIKGDLLNSMHQQLPQKGIKMV